MPAMANGSLVAGAIGPAPLKSVSGKRAFQASGRRRKSHLRISRVVGVIGVVGPILYIIDFVTEALEADNIMNVLPDNSRNGA